MKSAVLTLVLLAAFWSVSPLQASEEIDTSAHLVWSIGPFLAGYPAADFAAVNAAGQIRLPIAFEAGALWRSDRFILSFGHPMTTGLVAEIALDRWRGVPSEIISSLVDWSSEWYVASTKTDGPFLRFDLGLGGTHIYRKDETESDGGSWAGPAFQLGAGYQFPASRWNMQLKYESFFVADGQFQFGVVTLGMTY